MKGTAQAGSAGVSNSAPAAEAAPEPDVLAGLLNRVARGDNEAFARVYDEVAEPVYGAVHRLVGDAAQAQEVTEQVLLRVWQSASQFDPAAGNALSWTLRLARQGAVGHKGSAADGGIRPADRPGRDGSPAQTDALLSRLPRRERQLLELAVLDGLSVSEIAARLDVAPAEVTARLRGGLLEAGR